MQESGQGLADLIALARSGDDAALGQLLDEYRDYLRLLAQRAMDGRLAGRIDASDVVQQTCLSAIRRFSEFDGVSGDDLAGWLYRIHERNLVDAARHHLEAKKRTVTKEAGADEAASADVIELTSPSQRIMRGERAARLSRALAELSTDQAEAIRLKHLDGWSLAEVASRMKKTERSVAGLLQRGLENLRQQLTDEFGE
jgi:RNA polymerase sigma-70 factor (ECF subfamily)